MVLEDVAEGRLWGSARAVPPAGRRGNGRSRAGLSSFSMMVLSGSGIGARAVDP
jgi:hypothetical protein